MLPVGLLEGRGNSECIPRQPALRALGWGNIPGRRAEGGKDQSWVPAWGHRQERSGRRLLGGPRVARTVGLSVYSAGALKSGAAKAPALPAPARDSRPHFPLLPAPSLQ